MNDKQILERIERFLDAPVDDALIKNFTVDIVKRNENKSDSGMLMILMVASLGYCESGRTLGGVDITNMKLIDMAEPENLKNLKIIMTEHQLGKDFSYCSSFIVNAFGNRMMNTPFSKWSDLAKQTAIMAYKAGAEFDDDASAEKDIKQNDDMDDSLTNDLLSILGNL